MANFSAIFAAAVVLCSVVTFLSSDFYRKTLGKQVGSKDPLVTEEVIKVHNNLLKKYLFVYLLATLSDWLQGPFVYALYMDYGFKQHEIAQLFVAGFGSSMIFGSFIGGMADWGGRRLFVIIYAVVYAASCLTKRKYMKLSACPLDKMENVLILYTFPRFQQLRNPHARSTSGRSFNLFTF